MYVCGKQAQYGRDGELSLRKLSQQTGLGLGAARLAGEGSGAEIASCKCRNLPYCLGPVSCRVDTIIASNGQGPRRSCHNLSSNGLPVG